MGCVMATSTSSLRRVPSSKFLVQKTRASDTMVELLPLSALLFTLVPFGSCCWHWLLITCPILKYAELASLMFSFAIRYAAVDSAKRISCHASVCAILVQHSGEASAYVHCTLWRLS